METYPNAWSVPRLVLPAGLVQRGEGRHVDAGLGWGWRGRPGGPGHHLVHHHLRVGATERDLATVQLPQEDAEAVDVAVGGGGLPSQELWSLVAGRPHQAVVHPQAEVTQRDRTSKVSEFADTSPVDQDIGGLDIQVNDALAVTVREGKSDLLTGLNQPAPGQLLVLQLHQQAVEVPAAHVLHDDHRVPSHQLKLRSDHHHLSTCHPQREHQIS